MPGGEAIAYFLVFGAVMAIAFIVLLAISVPWAFSERRGARIAYWVALVPILAVNAYWLVGVGPGFLLGLLFEPIVRYVAIPHLIATVWVVLGVPMIRWWRHRPEGGGIEKPRPKIPRKAILAILGALILLVVMFDSLHLVEPEEVGVVLRFGAYNRTADPGLRFKIPAVEDVIMVPVMRQLKQEFGFRTVETSGIYHSPQRLLQESSMLTGDLNVAVVEWVVRYRIEDAQMYLFRARNVEELFRDMNEAVMRRVVRDLTLSDVLTIVERQEIEAAALVALRELVGESQMGIAVYQVGLHNVSPPDPVKPSWEELNGAELLRDRLISEAQARQQGAQENDR